MPRKKKQAAEEGEEQKGGDNKVDGKADLPGHKVPDTHLSKQAGKETPGGDGDENTPEGTAHAGAIAGGVAGQRVGLPAPLSAKEAKEQGMATDAQEKEADDEEKGEGNEGGEE